MSLISKQQLVRQLIREIVENILGRLISISQMPRQTESMQNDRTAEIAQQPYHSPRLPAMTGHIMPQEATAPMSME